MGYNEKNVDVGVTHFIQYLKRTSRRKLWKNIFGGWVSTGNDKNSGWLYSGEFKRMLLGREWNCRRSEMFVRGGDEGNKKVYTLLGTRSVEWLNL